MAELAKAKVFMSSRGQAVMIQLSTASLRTRYTSAATHKVEI
jgi:hypothetical protein